MAAPKGHARYGGRQKGTPNKAASALSVRSRIEELGIDLVGNILREIELMDRPQDKAKCYLQLLEYCDAKRKAIEVTESADPELEKIRNMSTPELIELVKKEIA